MNLNEIFEAVKKDAVSPQYRFYLTTVNGTRLAYDSKDGTLHRFKPASFSSESEWSPVGVSHIAKTNYSIVSVSKRFALQRLTFMVATGQAVLSEEIKVRSIDRTNESYMPNEIYVADEGEGGSHARLTLGELIECMHENDMFDENCAYMDELPPADPKVEKPKSPAQIAAEAKAKAEADAEAAGDAIQGGTEAAAG